LRSAPPVRSGDAPTI